MIIRQMQGRKRVEVVEEILFDFGYFVVGQVQRDQLFQFLDFVELLDFIVRQIDRPSVVRKTEKIIIEPENHDFCLRCRNARQSASFAIHKCSSAGLLSCAIAAAWTSRDSTVGTCAQKGISFQA